MAHNDDDDVVGDEEIINETDYDNPPEEIDPDEADEIGCPHCGLTCTVNNSGSVSGGRLRELASGELHRCSGMRGALQNGNPSRDGVIFGEDDDESPDDMEINFSDYE